MIQTIDGISFKIKELHNFDFLMQYGHVFKVYDDQDSGNICFGIGNEKQKVFVKYAGAATAEYNGKAFAAIDRLKAAMPNYRVLQHPDLVQLIDHYPTDEGYAAVFLWAEGACMGRQNPFWQEFALMPLENKLKILDAVFCFHQNVAEKGYTAIDFYDGCILYDFVSGETKICDIDSYARSPYINNMGRMWGSRRFMSPEEFEKGAVIDERTMVFNMGSVAFVVLGGSLDRSFEKWTAGEGLYRTALKAVSKERSERFPSLREWIAAWNRNKPVLE